MEHDRGDEDVGGPVVRLADQEPRLHVQREVDGGLVRPRHLRTVERRVGPVVRDDGPARLEEEREVDPGRDEDDEAVERHLSEQERPVVREDVAQRLPQERRRRGALVDEPHDAPDHGLAFRLRTPHHDGPTAPEKLPAARSSPRPSTARGSWGRSRPAGPKRTVPPAAGSNVE